MIYYNQPNIAAANQAISTYPNNVYLPLNTGRTVANQIQNLGRFIDERPAKSIELTDLVNTSIRNRRLNVSFLPVRTVAAAYTANPLTDSVFIVSTTATITLPDPASYVGWKFSVRSLSGVTTTLDPIGSTQIEGSSTSVTVTTGAFKTFISNGTSYYQIS